MLLMYNIFENVTRYNISENDHTHLIQMQGSLEGDKSMIYNNVFYIDYGMADIDYFLTREPENLGRSFGTTSSMLPVRGVSDPAIQAVTPLSASMTKNCIRLFLLEASF